MRYFWALMAYVVAIVVSVASCGGSKAAGGSGAPSGGTGGSSGTQSSGTMGTSVGGTGTSSVSTFVGSSSSATGTSSSSSGNPHCPGYKSCADQKATCGSIGDGCGNIQDCGSCPSNQSCGGGGTPNQCGTTCVALTCMQQGFDCGMAGDGCGGTIACGPSCPSGQSCGANNMPNVCGVGICTTQTCSQLGFDCGMQTDGCMGLQDCGTCSGNETCGGGGKNGVCGSSCMSQTCAQQGFDCGMATDLCNNIINCGTCPGNESCGGGGSNKCGVGGGACTGLCLLQMQCPNMGTTSITGTVYAPNGTDPLYDALVYVPNGGPGPTYGVQPFPPGVSCSPCGSDVSGNPLVQAVTGVDGKFTITNMPVGTNIPLVIQLGHWRRQVTIPNVAACTNTAVPANLTNMPNCRTSNAACPAGKAKGDIPLMAFVTGCVDALECVFRKVGVDDTEFTDPMSIGGNGRIQIFQGDTSLGGINGCPGAVRSASTPDETQLWGSQATINQYDMVLFACQGAQYDKTAAAQQTIINYANAGGRIFSTHYEYVWLYDDAPFSGTANWNVSQAANFCNDTTYPAIGDIGIINQGFPKGMALAQWLQIVGASTTLGQIPIYTLRRDFDGAVPPSTLWMTTNDPCEGNNVPMHYDFLTPVGAQPANQCGRVVFDDFHVEDQAFSTQPTFPGECTLGAMTPQEKLLEFFLFDLASCVAPPQQMCMPTTCAAKGATCGPIPDGCGGILQCGMCPSGQACINGVCGSGCMPKTCAQEGFQCGMQSDGCGNAINCGNCPSGTCGGGGPGMCGSGTCTPKGCGSVVCGATGDGCGNIQQCGTCPSGENCMNGMCQKPPCMAKTCADYGFNCGMTTDGCNNVINCGTCQAPQTCGGGGQANKCGGGSGA